MSYDLSSNLLSAPTPIAFTDCRIGLREIPLNLLAYILSYISDARTLAACCATSRLLYYMARPALYRNITLTSSDEVSSNYPYVEDGIWSASPFCMGLNALVTRETARWVHSLHFQGHWQQHDQENNAKRGRLADSSVLLNIAIRAAIDRCVNLQSFKWTLDTRPMSMLYSGLANLKDLRVLNLRFPSDCLPHPKAVLPALPKLRQLGFTDYDPLCYPDDLSMILLHATDLESLSMHFSPRMKNAKESVPLLEIFHRCVSAKQKLRLRSLAVYNVLTNPDPEINEIFLPDRLEELTLLNSFGPACTSQKSQATHWIDQSWAFHGGNVVDVTKMRMIRIDKINHLVLKDLATMPNLERIYFVNSAPPKTHVRHVLQSPTLSRTSSSDGLTPIGPPVEVKPTTPRFSQLPHEILRDSLVDTITKLYGTKLKHVILPSRLPVNVYNIARLVASCPNLTQLAFAMEEINPEALRHIGPVARRLRCCRILAPNGPGSDGKEQRKRWDEFEAREDHAFYFDLEFRGVYGNDPLDTKCLKYIGMGQKVWEVGSLYWETNKIQDEDGNEMEQRVYQREIKPITLSDVEDVEIWKYDTSDPV